MKKKKSFLLFFLLFFLLINLVIFFSGKTWLYHGVAITYLKGYTSSYIHDFVYFPANKINAGQHQEWLVSKNYNKVRAPNFLADLNLELESTAFMIIQNDSVKYEKYWQGYYADSISNSFSIAKSLVSALVGIAIKDKKITGVNQAVCDFLPEFCSDERSKITIKHLLNMSAGLDWSENYYNPLGNAAHAYYGNDLKNLILNLKSIKPAGTFFEYNSACTQLLVFILEVATKETVSDYASKKLWVPLGAKHPALWNTDKKGGDEKGFCCINSNARDFARLGRLFLNYGNWKGVQIIDSSFVKEATMPSNLHDVNGKEYKEYGYQFWITNYKGLSIYYGRGLWGQYVICIPEKDIIIVRLGRKNRAKLENGHHEELYSFVDAALKMYD